VLIYSWLNYKLSPVTPFNRDSNFLLSMDISSPNKRSFSSYNLCHFSHSPLLSSSATHSATGAPIQEPNSNATSRWTIMDAPIIDMKRQLNIESQPRTDSMDLEQYNTDNRINLLPPSPKRRKVGMSCSATKADLIRASGTFCCRIYKHLYPNGEYRDTDRRAVAT